MASSLFNGTDAQDTQTTVRQAAEMLRAGKIVILPTETVYGIAFSLESPEARARVKAMKALPANPKWVIHVPSAEVAMERYAPELSALGRRVMQKCWPGPVAIHLQPTAQEQANLGSAVGRCDGGDVGGGHDGRDAMVYAAVPGQRGDLGNPDGGGEWRWR